MKTIQEAAAELGVSPRRVRVLCATGRIKGARLFNGVWIIPNKFTVKTAARQRPGKITPKE